MSVRTLLVLLTAASAIGFVGTAQPQTVVTYTNNQSGSARVPLGFPVPIPVASLTPVDGFRDHASLEMQLMALDAQSADLRGHQVGQTRNGRPVRAYVVSDADTVDVEGRAEAAFFINAATHAREWGAPEVSTYLVERIVAGADDGGLVRYLLDNTRLVIIPVQNIDGLQQTQRYPDQVIIGQDPRFPNDWPRDGRMRRKNMIGVDENLSTFGDHLLGVDINRNHPPFWGTVTNGGQLTNPNDLTFRGAAAHSEPENQALLAAAQLAPAVRLRLGVDIHSYSQVFFSSNTGRARLGNIQRRLISSIGQHHFEVPTADGAPNGKFYRDVPDPPNSGIGTAAEFFAYQWLVPAWTLELEPQNSAQDYGGLAVSHSGFILPESQVRRVREAWAESFLVAFYFMSGAPHLVSLRIVDADTGELLRGQRWTYDASQQRRVLSQSGEGLLFPGRRVRVELGFNKPMRHRDAQGVVRPLPGHGNVVTVPFVRLAEQAGERLLDTSQGSWGGDDNKLRYRDDTFSFEYVIDTEEPLRFAIEAFDMVGLQLDAYALTPVDWFQGAWSGWEDSDLVAGDTGGVDRTLLPFEVSAVGDGSDLTLESTVPTVIGEGDAVAVQWRRSAAAPALPVELSVHFDDGPVATASWAAGESGVKTVRVRTPEDVDVQGMRTIGYEARVNGSSVPLMSGTATLLDNDRPGRSVVRVSDDLAGGLALHADSPATQRDVVLDGGRDYQAPVNLLTVCQPFEIAAPVNLYGNRASVSPSANSCFGPRVSGSGSALLRDLRVLGEGSDGARANGVSATGVALALARVQFEGTIAPSVEADIPLTAAQVSIVDALVDGDAFKSQVTAAGLQADALSIAGSARYDTLLRLGPDGSEVTHSTLYRNSEHVVPVGFAGGSLGIRGSVVHETSDNSDLGSPPAGPVCFGLFDLGMNWYTEDGDADCPLPNNGPLDLGARVEPLGYYLPNAQLIDAGGTGCGPVDLRGAPRPQSRTPGAEPLCDIGAVEDGVNPWRGLWIPDRSGHGIDMQTAGNVLFILWYTYADDGTPVAYQAAAPLTGPTWNAELLLASRNPQTAAITNTRVGTVRIEFASDHQAQLTWRFDARGTEGGEGIRAYSFAVGEPRFETTGTWYPPAESGYGASLTRRGEVTSMALYYYDASGKQRWALGASNAADVVDIELSSFTGFCPDCDAMAMPVQSQPAGSARVHFLTPERASVDTDLTYPGTEGGRWQRDAADFVPLNDPVDNREIEAMLNPQADR